MSSHNPNACSSTLAELSLIKIIERDRVVLAERDAAAAAAKKEEMRLNMRSRALERAARNRKLKSAVPPATTRRTGT